VQRLYRLVLPVLLVIIASTVWAGSEKPAASASKPATAPTLAAKMQLPDFSVTDPAGGTVESGQFSRKGKWILIYMNADCRACDSLLRALTPGAVTPKEALPRAKQVVILVGRLGPSQLKGFAALYPGLQQASWYADLEQKAFTKLKLAGAPVAVGLQDSRIEWSLDEPHAAANFHKSALRTWLK
jgi:hypothetical protein